MDGNTRSTTAKEVRELLEQALDLLDAQEDHLVGAHIAHAIGVLDSKRDQS